MRIQTTGFLFALSEALDCVERELFGVTVNHSKRVALVSMRLCALMGMSDEEVFDMASCAVLHDNALTHYMLRTGAAGIARLENLSMHCGEGERNARVFPFQGSPEGVIMYHHENWNGTGFFGKRGEEIPLRAAILRLADGVDLRFAMGSGDRRLLADIPAHVRRERGRLYAPQVADAFLELFNEDCLRQQTAAEIDDALRAAVPDIGGELTIPQLMRSCGLFSAIIDAKSVFTLNHSRGIAQKTGIMSSFYKLEREHAGKLVIAAHLHDVGKLSTPSAILEKPGPLDDAEFAVMRDHVRMTWDILSPVPGFENISLWAASHHEKLDGSGYPFRREAVDLPFESRLLGCVDIYQALTEDRPYRAGMTHREAMRILQSMAADNKVDAGIVRDLETTFG